MNKIERRKKPMFTWFGFYAFDRVSWLHGICWKDRRITVKATGKDGE